jgi:PucR C-terminal helix-turn-helix domain
MLRPRLTDVVAEVIAAGAVAVPAYARPLEGRFGEGVRQGVEVALGRFLELPGTTAPALSPESRSVYAALGRGEVRQGRTLEGLLAAYRAGARVTLRRMSRVAMDAGLDTDALVALGESVLAYIEELSAASAEGFAFEQSERAGEMDRRRIDLLELLLHGQADDVAAQTAAAAAGWVLPTSLVAVTMPLDEASGVRFRLGSRALAMARATDAVALVPSPRSARERGELERALEGRGAVVGPARDWRRVPDSLRLATMAATTLDGSAPRTGREAFWVEDHLADLVLAAESQALDDLATMRLKPFEGLRPAQREKLAETLVSWLRHWGQRGPIARELSIHPQTVGYRLTQLRELFGEALDDPQVRFELELVLRAGHR